jgi:hypothetical protein
MTTKAKVTPKSIHTIRNLDFLSEIVFWPSHHAKISILSLSLAFLLSHPIPTLSFARKDRKRNQKNKEKKKEKTKHKAVARKTSLIT